MFTRSSYNLAFALLAVTVAGCQEQNSKPGRPRILVVEAAEIEKAAETAGDRRVFYVSPNGRAENDGSQASPWSLEHALSHPRRVEPGDRIYMLEGVYGDGRKLLESKLTGEPGNPVVLRAAPGARARLYGGMIVRGAHAWYWGFEVFNDAEVRTGGANEGPTAGYPEGIIIFGPGTKFINLVVHDTAQGFSFWEPAVDAEIYGCIVYHNGHAGPTRGHGHGIYTQNSEGWKLIRDNIIFNQFGLGIQAYGSDKALVRGYVIDGNILVNNGIIYGKSRGDNLLLANGNGLERIRVRKNHSYHAPADASGYSRVGWNDNAPNKDAVITDNYFIGGYTALEMWNWQNLSAYRNTAYVTDGFTALVTRPSAGDTAYEVDNNTYYGNVLFRFNNQNRNWDQWRGEGLDKNSKLSGSAPQANWVFVRPNRFERGRANIVIYNWENLDSVTVDLGKLARPGANYRLKDAQNYFAEPLLTGAFSGTTISVPMKGLTMAAPAGRVPNPPAHTAPRFGMFVLEVDKN